MVVVTNDFNGWIGKNPGHYTQPVDKIGAQNERGTILLSVVDSRTMTNVSKSRVIPPVNLLAMLASRASSASRASGTPRAPGGSRASSAPGHRVPPGDQVPQGIGCLQGIRCL